MVSIIKETLRREEAGLKMREWIKEGYVQGRWKHIPQTDYVELRAWKEQKNRGSGFRKK